MRVIRRGVFETNSSSTHSLCIGSGDLTDLPTPAPDGKIHVYAGEYGWEECHYGSVSDRMSYAYTYAKDDRDDERLMAMLGAVIKQHTGREVVFEDGDVPGRYIDHQSREVAAEVFRDEEVLAQFLFCPESYFVTDNDNH